MINHAKRKSSKRVVVLKKQGKEGVFHSRRCFFPNLDLAVRLIRKHDSALNWSWLASFGFVFVLELAHLLIEELSCLLILF